MEFLSRTQVIVAVGATALAIYVLDLVRRRRLAEDYALMWMVSSTVIALLGFSTPVLQWITRLLGMMYESSTVFAAGLGFALYMLLFLSVRMSRLTQEHLILTRELALLRHDRETPPGAEGRP